MVEDLATEMGYRFASSVENSGEEPEVEELELEREGMESVGRRNASWVETWEGNAADFVSG